MATETRGTFGSNFKAAWGHYSTYFVLAGNLALAWYLNQTPEQQTALLASIPLLAPLAPFASVITFFLLKSTPQGPRDETPPSP